MKTEAEEVRGGMMDEPLNNWKVLGCLICLASAAVMVALLSGIGYAVLVWVTG